MTDISNRDDVIDSRDVIERIEALGSERETLVDAIKEAAANQGDETAEAFAIALNLATAALAEWEDDNAEELKALTDLQEDAEGYAPDWHHGATLVRDSHFKDYAEELAEDCGMIQAGATWPNNCIDWDEAARQLKQDYTQVEFDGVTYWVR